MLRRFFRSSRVDAQCDSRLVALEAENAQLKKEVAKQAYRIAHLVKMLNAEEAKANK